MPACWRGAIGEHYGRDFCFAVLVRAQGSSAQDASGKALAEVAGASGDDDSHAAVWRQRSINVAAIVQKCRLHSIPSVSLDTLDANIDNIYCKLLEARTPACRHNT